MLQKLWRSYMATIAACYWNTDPAPKRHCPIHDYFKQHTLDFCHYKCHCIKKWLSYSADIFTQGCFQDKAWDWYKHGTSFPRKPAIIGAGNFLHPLPCCIKKEVWLLCKPAERCPPLEWSFLVYFLLSSSLDQLKLIDNTNGKTVQLWHWSGSSSVNDKRNNEEIPGKLQRATGARRRRHNKDDEAVKSWRGETVDPAH